MDAEPWVAHRPCQRSEVIDGVPGVTVAFALEGAAGLDRDTDGEMVGQITVLVCAPRLMGEALCAGLINNAVASNVEIYCTSATSPEWMPGSGLDIVVLCFSAVTLENLRRIQVPSVGHNRPRVLLLLSQVDRDILGPAIQSGIDGCLSDRASLNELRDALVRIHSGQSVFAPDLALRLMSEPPRPLRAAPLAPRELEVLQVIATGASTDVAAARLGITIHTVRAHLKSAMAKLNAHSKTEAVLTALKSGYVVLPE
jgi:DNA-binding NarL/FixJ family response regulator